MLNWKELKKSEYDRLWDFVYDELDFHPYAEDIDSIITLPKPDKNYDISKYINEGFKEEYFKNLYEVVGSVFMSATKKGDHMYALDYQHPGYSFDPYAPPDKNELGEWPVRVYPNGDLTFFFSSDLKNGWFADGWNYRIHYYGEDFVKLLEEDMPKLLEAVEKTNK